MKRKSIVTIAIVVMLVAAMVVGGTLAYFTDTKEATNTFTVGNVKIGLIEKNANGTTFTNNQALVPGSQNAIAKRVTVSNTGSNSAYIWVEMKIPAKLLDVANGAYGVNKETFNSLHYNNYGYFTTEYKDQFAKLTAASSPVKDGYVDVDGNPIDANMQMGYWNDFHIVAADNEFVTLRSEFTSALEVGKTSTPALCQVYMDGRVTQNAAGQLCLAPYTTNTANAGQPYAGNWDIQVTAFAIQSTGFANVNEAIAGYSNAKA